MDWKWNREMDSSGFHSKLPTVSSSKPSDGIGAKLTPEQIGPLRIAPFDKLKEKHKKEKETQDVIEIDDDSGMFFRFWFKLLILNDQFFFRRNSLWASSCDNKLSKKMVD